MTVNEFYSPNTVNLNNLIVYKSTELRLSTTKSVSGFADIQDSNQLAN